MPHDAPCTSLHLWKCSVRRRMRRIWCSKVSRQTSKVIPCSGAWLQLLMRAVPKVFCWAICHLPRWENWKGEKVKSDDFFVAKPFWNATKCRRYDATNKIDKIRCGDIWQWMCVLSTARNLSAIQIVWRCSRRYFSIIILWKIPIPLIPGVVVSVFFSYSWPRLLSIFSPYSFRVPRLPIFGLVSSHSRPPCSLRIPALHGLLFVFSPCSFFLSLLISDPVSSPWPRLLFRAVSSPYSQYSLRISGLVSSQDTCPLRNISVFLASSPLILASSPLLNTEENIEREREREDREETIQRIRLKSVENTKKRGRIQREKTGKLTSWHLLSLVRSWRTPLAPTVEKNGTAEPWVKQPVKL